MVDVWARLEPHLASVQKPARYIGCELGAEVPPPAPGRVGWLLVYPDTYEIGLPNQGLQILYEILNERADALAERSYAPWTDLHEVMEREGIPLPFMSYGGSSTLTAFAAMGLVLNVHMRRFS